MTPAGTSNELDVQNEWEENIHTHSRLQRKKKTKAVTTVHVQYSFQGAKGLKELEHFPPALIMMGVGCTVCGML